MGGLLALALLAPSASADHPENEGCAVTPGGWGAPPEGNNPGAILHDHFDEIFPDGLVVDGLTFETAQEITDTLVVAGDPLLNHAVALAINLAFGNAGLLDGSLQGVDVSSDDEELDGLTAEQILALAEDALDDPDRSTPKYSSLIDAMDGLNNESFGCTAEPPCPAMVTAIPQGDGAILITWAAVPGADGYVVYRAIGSSTSFIGVASTTSTSFRDTTTAVGQTYTYKVVAVIDGVESEGCPAVVATSVPFFPGLVLGALAVVGSVGTFALLRRKA